MRGRAVWCRHPGRAAVTPRRRGPVLSPEGPFSPLSSNGNVFSRVLHAHELASGPKLFFREPDGELLSSWSLIGVGEFQAPVITCEQLNPLSIIRWYRIRARPAPSVYSVGAIRHSTFSAG